MREDDIARFVAELEDARPFEEASTTAVDGWTPDGTRGPHVEPWVGDVLVRCLRRVRPSEPPFGLAVVEGTDRARLYEQSPCETGEWFIERVREEAHLIAEPWLFVLMPQIRAVGELMWQSWAPTVEPRPFMLTWFLEARSRDLAAQFNGIVRLTGEEVILRSWDFTDPPRAFADMLRGHPARRRYRISR